MIQQQGTTMWSEVRPWTGLWTPAQWKRRRSLRWMRPGYHNAQRAFLPSEQQHNEVYTCTEFFSGGPTGPQRDARCGNASPPGAALSRE